MQLKEFISQTLAEIVEGVKDAQAKTLDSENRGTYVNPFDKVTNVPRSIDFDVAVTATEGTSTKGGIGVFMGAVGLGSQGQSEAHNTSLNRIRFSVSVLLPRGSPPTDKM